MPDARKIQDRYELGEPLGRGGMGVVYKAYDTLMKRHVALKTVLDVENSTVRDLFYKEWGVQAAIVHPNVAEIYDIGELEQDGDKKPFFVMPLLPGVGLDTLIDERSPRLTVARVIDIFAQGCRGLQAAHERGLIHRDLKPSNLFVMEDDSVKLIDFGIAHVATEGVKTTLKGTLSYMAPEQIRMEGPSVRTDIFSLGVSCYEALTGARPFLGKTDHEISQAILKKIPAPASELNSECNEAISQVIHKALAKDPWHRFGSARELGDALTKALRGETLEVFNSEKIKPRLERASQAFDEGDYDFAGEVLSELEAEGQLDPQIGFLRSRLDQAVKQRQTKKLLESARRFQEANELGLALRKIQEALDLDPDDSDAQALQHEIEKERRRQQIGEWLTLAREHLENDAFGPARQAIDNILAVSSTDEDALRVRAEIDQREKELARLREEKSRLYSKARKAFDRGDVTGALSKLEHLVELEDERPDTERAGTYRQLYQQVRSEHDDLRASYDRARTLLAEEKFSDALALCDQKLAKYPNHALFQALRFDVEQGRRQSLSKYIAEVDRRIETEPDVDKRLEIAEEALKQYPEEPHFQQAAKLARDKRDLVTSIVQKARFFEEKGQIQEALDQWQVLGSIYPEYPGRDVAVEALEKKREEQRSQEDKTSWAEKIDRLIESGQFAAAIEAAGQALEKYPDDLALQELQRLAERSREKTRIAGDLLSSGREALEEGDKERALVNLREAYKTHDRDVVVRGMLVNTLVDVAKAKIGDDRDEAEKLLEEALEVDPADKTAQLLRDRIADRKKEEFLSWTLTQARKLQAEDDLAGAVALVEQGLTAHPSEPRLEQLRATLERAQQPQTGTHAAPDFEASDEATATFAASDDQVGAAAGAAEPPKAPPPDDDAATAFGDEDEPTVRMARPKKPTAEKKRPPKKTPVKEAAARSAEPKKRKPAAAAAAGPFDRIRAALAGGKKPVLVAALAGGLLAGVVAVALVVAMTGGDSPIAGDGVAATIRTSPAGAAIFVDGEPCGESLCEASLTPGSHQIEARRAGYQAAFQSISIDPEQPLAEPITLMLTPLAPALEISSDLERGQVTLDDEVVGELDQGQFRIENLPPGPHTLTINDRGARATAEIEVEPGQVPVVRNLETNSLKAVMIASLGGDALVYTDSSDMEAALDGSPVGVSTPEGLELAGLTEGPHELRVGPEGSAIGAFFDAGARPVLTASLKSDRNVGALRIQTGEDDVTVYLNGNEYRRRTARGGVLIYLVPGEVEVRVEKAGYRPVPPKTANIVKGGQERLEFDLQPLPRQARLVVRNGAPGAEVLLDGRSVGTVNDDGGFTLAGVEPGTHTVTLRKELFEEREVRRDFDAGSAVEISGSLEPITGTLELAVAPPDVEGLALTLEREGEARSRPLGADQRRLTVPEGVYTVTAQAPGYNEFAATLRVERGQTRTAELRLEPAPDEDRYTAPAVELEDLIEQSGWSPQGELAVKQGGDMAIVQGAAGPGVYTFTIWLQNGRRIEWAVDYEDSDNYILYEIERRDLVRHRYSGGDREKEVDVPHGLDRSGYISFRVETSESGVVVKARKGDAWEVIDEWRGSGATDGAFAFHLRGGTQYALSHFTFYPM